MLTLLTDENELTPYTLKVVWIEDQHSLGLDKPDIISRYFTIYRAYRPDQVSKQIKNEIYEIFLKRGNSKKYNFPCLPADGFLADFDLTGAGKDVASRLKTNVASQLQTEQESPEDKARKAELKNLEDQAKGAEAAGLTTAVLAALNFESHPCIIVPYTAKPAQLASQRALILLLAPPSIFVGRGASVEQGKPVIERKLQQFAEDYRKNLTKWVVMNVISFPSGEQKRLKELAKTRSYMECGKNKVRWSDNDTISFNTTYGERQISCFALWFRQDGADPLFKEVYEWLDKIPMPNSVYSEAAQLAEQYWEYSVTDNSCLRYALSWLIRSYERTSAESDVEEIKNDIKNFCDLLEIDYNKAINSSDDVEMPEGNYVPHLLDLPVSKEVKRLAVFMLLAKEDAARKIASKDPNSYIAKLNNVFNLSDSRIDDKQIAPNKIDFTKIEDKNVIRILKILSDLGLRWESKGGKQYLTRNLEKAADLTLRLDPIPKQLLTATEDFKAGRIGKALTRIGISLNPLIKEKGDGGMETSEKLEVREYMRELGLSQEIWAKWLSNDSVK